MFEDEFGYSHYIKVDDEGRIISYWSDGPCLNREPESDEICITRDGSYQFRFEPEGVENPSLVDDDGICLYKWDGKRVVDRTKTEMDHDFFTMDHNYPPTAQEQLRADIDYLLVLQGVPLNNEVMLANADSASDAFRLSMRYFPREWNINRLSMLVDAGKLTPSEYEKVVNR